MCTPRFVDEAMRNKIAAYNARFRKVTASPFGSDDQIGMLNLTTLPRATPSSAVPTHRTCSIFRSTIS